MGDDTPGTCVVEAWWMEGGWGGGDLRDGDGVGDVQQDDTSCDHAVEGGVAAEV